MEKSAVEAKAKQIFGTPAGFQSVLCNGPVGTGVVVNFDTAVNMKTFVDEMKAKAFDPLYVRKNRPQKNSEEKAISEKVTEAWDKLKKAGVDKSRLRANPRKGIVWIIGQGGIAEVAATVANATIAWGTAAPSGASN